MHGLVDRQFPPSHSSILQSLYTSDSFKIEIITLVNFIESQSNPRLMREQEVGLMHVREQRPLHIKEMQANHPQGPGLRSVRPYHSVDGCLSLCKATSLASLMISQLMHEQGSALLS